MYYSILSSFITHKEVFYLKEIYIERKENFLRAAVMEDGMLIECLIEEETSEPKPGQIYKGVVKNIVPAIKCAFVDIGFDKNCYMYLDRKFNNTSLKKNEELMVEVLKESVGDKGPKVTNALSLPGRYAVLETINTGINFSKKIKDEGLKTSMKEAIIKPEDVGVTLRTNAAKISVEIINKEIEQLYGIYSEIKRESQHSVRTKLLYSGEGIIEKLVRDIVDENTSRVIVDNEEDYNHFKKFLGFAKELNCRVEQYNDSRALFAAFGIEKEILNLRDREIRLNEGSHIVIDKTEAMYVIDVNSGKNTKGSSLEKTAFETNLKAAEEIARQVRLRNLSGIILVDFIDMTSHSYKDKILNTLKAAFEGDKSKVNIYPFTELNLVQIARERKGRPISEYIEERCSACHGRGKRIRLWYLTGLIRNELLKIVKEHQCRHILLELDETYKAPIVNELNYFVENIGGKDCSIYVKFVEEENYFKIEPLIFQNHIENAKKYKIYG
jgi:ribonuclease G